MHGASHTIAFEDLLGRKACANLSCMECPLLLHYPLLLCVFVLNVCVFVLNLCVT